MIKLKVKQRGHLLIIPGIAPFRTPAKIDISNVKIRLVVSALNNAGIDDYEIISKEDKKQVIYTKKDFVIPIKKELEGIDNVGPRLDKIERILLALSKKGSKKYIPEEQITNKLKTLEELSQQILEKEMVREIVYTSTKESEGLPVVEELDEDTFIPDIDISDMELKGTSSKTIGSLDDVDEAADALSQLKRKGGK